MFSLKSYQPFTMTQPKNKIGQTTSGVERILKIRTLINKKVASARTLSALCKGWATLQKALCQAWLGFHGHPWRHTSQVFEILKKRRKVYKLATARPDFSVLHKAQSPLSLFSNRQEKLCWSN